ncbi:restriction endonuclease subunit S [Serratia entomophila]|uniref:restriction endonuclease subunit S n=1 Tax=Serratia entomophila TaxID=42906 RepID=UPI002177201C|nr:restriction endonuclease subunit S [Serratia entomophila]CAI0709166.1 Type I restriction enzyme EcoKI specificity protein [Serratia entomophila]CAI1638304.1 Type I restriction enzyme EcoKI specificity protein [Serratia entomophila]CAI1649094.1 Type I restriction enzyme EcoKI specificity protein [Serratia entomophila]CAI1698718.1 Type I restriction enzyme EcoKI specificity protein [Serratia entomophila]CAI1791634.1 Type I restriction enzyme EcoKI specificity protein [Serratia entomophila]
MSVGKFPEGWGETHLENVVEILDSMRVPVNNTERKKRIEGKDDSKLYPYYGATGEVGKIDDFIFDEELIALGEDGVPFFDGQKSKAYMLYGKTWVNNHAHVLKAIQGLSHSRFLCYFLNHFDYHDYVNGGTRLKLTQANMRKIPVRLAPLSEQKLIAEKLDTLLAQVNSTKARLEQIPQILKRFRQAVLASATSGKLTETLRQNNNLCHPKEIIIDNIVESSLYGPRFSKNDYIFETNGVPTIRTTDMERGNIIITDGTPRVCVPNEKIEQLKVKKNDLLITRTGSIGVMALFTEDYLAIPSAYLIRFRFKKNINSKYIYLCLTAPKGQQQMGLSATAITQSNINAKSIRNINIYYPDTAEQAEIVRRVEQLFACADTIEKQVNNALARVNSLTQSILAKAFRGELTAQWRAENPDLICGENSAAALLEKIKAERAASGGKKAARRKA